MAELPAVAGVSVVVDPGAVEPPQPNRVKTVTLTQPANERQNSGLCISREYSAASRNAHRDFSWIPISDPNHSRSSLARLRENTQKTPHLIGAGDSVAGAGRQSPGAQADRVVGQHCEKILVGAVIARGNDTRALP